MYYLNIALAFLCGLGGFFFVLLNLTEMFVLRKLSPFCDVMQRDNPQLYASLLLRSTGKFLAWTIFTFAALIYTGVLI